MKPAFSVIFFTVSSGAGLGLLVWLGLADLLTSAQAFAGPLDARIAFAALGTGLVFTTLGLCASTLHLANPRNAWRAFSQWRRSWLSREAVAAVALYPAAALYATGIALDAPVVRVAGAALVTALAIAVIHCTGMIYACLKTVPRWHHRLVPAGYLALGLYSGALLALGVRVVAGAGVEGEAAAGITTAQAGAALALLAAAAVVKVAYYARFGLLGGRPGGGGRAHHTLDTALSLPEARTRLLDVGHTHGTFLTDEFCFRLARERAATLRVVVLGLGFAVPAALLIAIVAGGVGSTAAPAFALVALVACLAGLVAERWLFFAEAEHVVRLYHGAARV